MPQGACAGRPVLLFACTRSGDIPLGGGGTIMDRCLAAGLPVASSCSGRGACGRCVVAILEGAGALSPAGPREQRVLRRNGHPEGARLACRSRVLDPAAPVRVRADYW